MTLVNADTGEVVSTMTPEEARAATAEIRTLGDRVWELLLKVKDGKGYKALGYPTFEAYLSGELDMSRSYGYRLIDQGKVVQAITEAAGEMSPMGDISERDARAIKPQLERITTEIRDRVAEGDDPEAAVADAIENARRRQREAVADSLTDSDDPVAEAQAILDTLEDPTDDAVADAVEEANESRRTPSGPPTKPDLGGGISHPARYSRELMPVLADAVPVERFRRVLDPFAGTGRIHELPNETVGIEIEPEWADLHPDTIVGSALALPFPNESFDAIVTSPTYGNRLADSHNASDPERRRSYTHDLGRSLNPDNSGAMQWGGEYRAFHEDAWTEAVRVLRPGGRFVLNIKDHIRDGIRQQVTAWHLSTLMLQHGLELIEIHEPPVPSLKAGANGAARIAHEYVFVLEAS